VKKQTFLFIVESMRLYLLPFLVGLNVWAAVGGHADPALCYGVAVGAIALLIATNGYFDE
jgi:hypothetical protein